MPETPGRTNLLGLPRPQLEAFCASLGSRPYRARQLMHWVYKRGCDRFEQMSDLARAFRAQLEQTGEIRAPETITRQRSSDGTCKWLLRADASQAFEMVYIPEPGRGTLCISSQVGCVLDCVFCATAQQGFNRNLSSAEIVGQVWLACRELGLAPGVQRPITNVVLMGMGEPLANLRNVVPALQLLLDDLGLDFSRRRLTLSTSGLVPQIYRLAGQVSVALAVSLHAPDDALRSELVPINRVHPIAELLEACWHYLDERNGRSVTFEYVMLDGVNDAPSQARALARLLSGRPAKVNLIPFNPFPGARFSGSSPEAIARFRRELTGSGVIATVRRTRGQDIDAACGQLVGRVQDRLAGRPAPRQGSTAGTGEERGSDAGPLAAGASGPRRARLSGGAVLAAALALVCALPLLSGCVTSQGAMPVASPAAQAAANLQLGVGYLREGELAIAQRKLELARREDPGNPDVHTVLALLYQQLHEDREAEREYRAAIALAPNDADALNDFGQFLCIRGRGEEGVRYIERAARNPRYPTPWVAYTNAGVCLRAGRHYRQAAREFQRAIRINPAFSEAIYQAAELDFVQMRYADARLLIDGYLLHGSNAPTADMLLLAWRTARAQGDPEAAARYARELAHDFPGSAQARTVATAEAAASAPRG